jgi:hypothetical protein
MPHILKRWVVSVKQPRKSLRLSLRKAVNLEEKHAGKMYLAPTKTFPVLKVNDHYLAQWRQTEL